MEYVTHVRHRSKELERVQKETRYISKQRKAEKQGVSDNAQQGGKGRGLT